MATNKQIRANRRNAKRSTGPRSLAARQASSRRRLVHGLNPGNASFYLLQDESEEKFRSLHQQLVDEHQPASATEQILVLRMAQHEWLRARALRLQRNAPVANQFALCLRYGVTHERAFYRVLNNLQTLRKKKKSRKLALIRKKPETSHSANY